MQILSQHLIHPQRKQYQYASMLVSSPRYDKVKNALDFAVETETEKEEYRGTELGEFQNIPQAIAHLSRHTPVVAFVSSGGDRCYGRVAYWYCFR